MSIRELIPETEATESDSDQRLFLPETYRQELKQPLLLELNGVEPFEAYVMSQVFHPTEEEMVKGSLKHRTNQWSRN